MLGSALALALDPARIVGAVGIEPDGWQAAVLRSSASQLLLNCSRQSGKSTVTAGVAVHTALYEPGALVLIVSPSLRQSGELFKKCLALYRALDRPVPAEAETRLTLELANGSRIVSLPGRDETIRGYSGVRLLTIDEAAQVPDDVYAALRPMLAVSGGRLIALSTPFGKRGWWYRAWTEGGDGWERYEVPATACPRISPAFLAEERRSLGDWWFDQEYLCGFRDTQDAVFSTEALDRAASDAVRTLYVPGWEDDDDGHVETRDVPGGADTWWLAARA
ncbi:MAG: phage terminase large subunit [Chloroflexota bacterium]|nr:phage terminase large subunit [Chloroflexota bacterium]